MCEANDRDNVVYRIKLSYRNVNRRPTKWMATDIEKVEMEKVEVT